MLFFFIDSKNVAGFDWDEGNQAKCQKHGVTLAEIESVFTGMPSIGPDAAHSTVETRFLAIGCQQWPSCVSGLHLARSERG